MSNFFSLIKSYFSRKTIIPGITFGNIFITYILALFFANILSAPDANNRLLSTVIPVSIGLTIVILAVIKVLKNSKIK